MRCNIVCCILHVDMFDIVILWVGYKISDACFWIAVSICDNKSKYHGCYSCCLSLFPSNSSCHKKQVLCIGLKVTRTLYCNQGEKLSIIILVVHMAILLTILHSLGGWNRVGHDTSMYLYLDQWWLSEKLPIINMVTVILFDMHKILQ